MSENQKGQNQSEGKKGGSGKLIIIIGIVIIVLLLAVIVLLLVKKEDKSETEQKGRETVESTRMVLDEETASTVIEEMRKEVEEGMFECNMAMKWTFENGTAESSDAYVANSENNTHPIYFDLYMTDTNELLYSSPIIPIGSRLTGIKLDKELPAGTYRATCAYSLLKDEESQEVISAANFIITLEIQE